MGVTSNPSPVEGDRPHACRPLSGSTTGPAAVAPWLLFIAATMVFLWPAIATGGPLGATDHLLLTSPYRETLPTEFQAGNPLQTDQLVQLPFIEEFWRSAREGNVQLWEPDVGGGVPLFTAVYNRVAGPWYAVLLFLPPSVGLTVAVGILFFVAQAGTYALARRLGAAVPGATLAAIVYAFAGATVVSVHRIHEVFVFPALLWALHRAVTQQRRVDLVLLGAVTAILWLSGFPSAAVFSTYAAIAFGIFLLVDGARRDDNRTRFWSRRTLSHAARPALAGLGGVMLASPQLFPTLEFLRSTSSLERRYGIWHATGLAQLADSVSGRFFGATQDGDWWLRDAALSNPYEASSTVGLIAVALVAVVAVLGRSPNVRYERGLRRFFLPTGIVVMIAVYLGGPVLGAIHLLPFTESNPFNRARFIFVLTFALTAGFGLDGLVGSPRSRTSATRGLRLQAGFILVMISMGIMMGLRLAAENHALREVATDLVIPVIVGLGALAVLRVMDRPIVIGCLVAALAAGELIWGTWGFTPASPPGSFYPYDRSMDAIVDGVGRREPFRFVGAGLDVLPPHAAALLDLTDARVQFPAFRPYEELLMRADPGLAETNSSASIFKVKFTKELDLASPILDRVSVRYVIKSLRREPLQLGERVVQPFSEADRAPESFDIRVPDRGMRAVRLPIGASDPNCTAGWIQISNGRNTSRRLLRDASNAITFPLPDIRGGHENMRLTSTDCPIRATHDEMAVYPPRADSNVRVISVNGWVVHERVSARPRWELARQVTALPEAEERLRAVSSEPANTVVVEDSSLEGTFHGGEVTPRFVGPDRLEFEVRSDGPGLMVLRDVAAPGWRVEVDGDPAPLLVVDHAFRGVEVPSGISDVTFAYAPHTLVLGGWVALLGVFILVVVGIGTSASHNTSDER